MPPKRKATTPSSAPAKRARSTRTKTSPDVYEVTSPSPPPPKRASRRNQAPSPAAESEEPKATESFKENEPPSIATRNRVPKSATKTTRAAATEKTISETPEPPVDRKKDVFDVSSSDDEIAVQMPVKVAVTTPVTARKRRGRPLMTYSTPGRLRSAGKGAAGKQERGGDTDELEDQDAATPSRIRRTVEKTAEVEGVVEEKKTEEVPEVKSTKTPRTATRKRAPASTAKKAASARKPPVEETLDGKEEQAEADDLGPGAKKTPARIKRPSTGRPSFGVEGMEDPFAVPDDKTPHKNDDILPSITLKETPKATPKPTSTPQKATPKKATPRPPAPSTTTTTEDPLNITLDVHPSSVAALQKSLLGKLTSRTPLRLVGLDEEFSTVHHLLDQTITAGEGNSMLIIGARGSGKSLLVNTALSQLTESYRGEFHIVRLNGLLQTDDRQALREIWRQLGVEMELDEHDQPKNTNFADTLSSILAILSHPDELQQTEEENPARTSNSVIFILDEFDHFALHPRQTLLYNLFDIAQAKKAPIAVLGLTCKVDVVDSLEKRVKSRFSHRTLHLKLPATLDAFWEIVKEGLTADPDLAAKAGGNIELYFETWNSDYLENLRNQPPFATLLRRAYNSTKTVAPVFTAALLPIAALTSESPFPPAAAYTPALAPPPSNLELLPSLSDIQTALLISAARLEVLVDTETVNFEMVYDEYLNLCTKTRVQATPSGSSIGRVWSKAVARAAWEGLEKCGLIVDAGRRGGLWRVDVSLMELRGALKGSQWLRWCKEVM